MWGLAALQGATPKCGSQWSWGDRRAPSSAFCAADNFGGALLHTPPCAFWCPLPTPGVRFGAAEPLAFNASMCLGTPCLYVSPPAIEVPGGGLQNHPLQPHFLPTKVGILVASTPRPPHPPSPQCRCGNGGHSTHQQGSPALLGGPHILYPHPFLVSPKAVTPNGGGL